MIVFIQEQWNKFPSHLKYILKLFVATRCALIIIGLLSVAFFRIQGDEFQGLVQVLHNPAHLIYMWAIWDSRWYFEIAYHGYQSALPFHPEHMSAMGFFPLYPLLMKGVGIIVRDYLLAGIIVSNAALIGAAHYLHKLIRLRSSEKTALRTILYLFIFPTAFMYSGVFAESLFLLLSLMCIYYAEKNSWGKVIIFAFLLGFTKPFAILLLVPLTIIYFKQRRFSLKNLDCSLDYGIAFLASIPLAFGLFFLYCYEISGDAFAYFHVQQHAFTHTLSNPFFVIMRDLITLDAPYNFVNAVFILLFLAVLILRFKKIPLSYWIYGVALILFTPMEGASVGSLRYAAFNFPLIIAFSLLTTSDEDNQLTIAFLTLLQGGLMIFWVIGNAIMA